MSIKLLYSVTCNILAKQLSQNFCIVEQNSSKSKLFSIKHYFENQTSGIKRQSAQQLHGWKRQMDENGQRRKIIPKLVYLHNPWKYIVTKFNMFKLKVLWDREFVERDFIAGTKQAVIVMTNIIRNHSTNEISQFTTPIGFQQITRDMVLSRNDARLKLVKFEKEHLRRAIPMRVSRRSNFGRKYCFIDMLFVVLRNTKDFDSQQEAIEFNEALRKLDADLKVPDEVSTVPHRIIFAEIFMRFRRDYTDSSLMDTQPNERDWAVSFYKILTFDILNYDPKP